MNRRVITTAALIVAAFAGLFLVGYVPLVHRESTLRAETRRAASAPPAVTVARPRRAPATDEVVLPGTIDSLEATTIYARVNGYLQRRLVDIGDQVEEGALLAEIETPELDQERLQAEATVSQLRARLLTAEASVRLTQSTYARYKGAADRGGISPQQLAEAAAAVETATATVEAAKQDIAAALANVRRLEELLSFAKVRAPFAGTITQRTIEVGGLVTAGNGTSQALFRIALMDPIRVMVHVPQIYATAIGTGAAADLIVREYTGRAFKGEVTRTAGALEVGSRTMLTQIEAPNRDRALIPGMYAQAKLVLPHAGTGLRIPAGALVVNADGMRVATVGAGDKVHFVKVGVAADYGTELAIEGLTGEERVVMDPSDRLVEGGVVRISTPPAPASTPAPAPAAAAAAENAGGTQSAETAQKEMSR